MVLRKTSKAGEIIKRLSPFFSVVSILLLSNIACGQSDFDENKLILEPVLLSQVDPENDGLSLDPGLDEGSENLIEQSLSRTLDISQYEQALEELESTQGPYAVGLAEQLDSLGRIYQETGDHRAAIDFFERSKHITRVNHGLFSLEQLVVEEKIIASYQAMGELETVDALREYLFYIKRKNYQDGDPEMTALKRELADWNVESLLRMYNTSTASMPLFNSGNENLKAKDYVLITDGFNSTYLSRDQFLNSSSTIMISAINMNILVEPRLKEARELYQEMLEEAQADLSEIDTGNTYSPEIQTLQRTLADISYIVKNKMELMARDTGDFSSSRNSVEDLVESVRVVARGYQVSRDAFEEIIEALKSAPNTSALDLALAILDLADWNLIFAHEHSAATLYGEAYSVLKESGMTELEIENVLAPQVELPLPAYSVHQYSRQMQGLNRDSEVYYKGYIDIEYRLDRYGKRRSVTVLAMSEATPPRLRRIIVDHLRSERVRPIITDGLVMRDSDLQLRYYYTY